MYKQKSNQMKKNNYYIVLLFVLLVSTNSCKKQFDQYTPDPNNPVTVPPYLVLRQVLDDMIVYPFGDADKFGFPFVFKKHLPS